MGDLDLEFDLPEPNAEQIDELKRILGNDNA